VVKGWEQFKWQGCNGKKEQEHMHKHLFSLLKTDRVVLKSLRHSSFKKGTVLYQSTLFLHCSAVLIYRSCSMKYLAETKHMHPLSSGWKRKCIFPPPSGTQEWAEYYGK